MIVNVASALGVTAADAETPLSCYVASKHGGFFSVPGLRGMKRGS